jgi:hypothetical protein
MTRGDYDRRSTCQAVRKLAWTKGSYHISIVALTADSLSRLLRASLLIAALGCHVNKVAPRDPERLSQEEMRNEHFTNVYDAVASLRSAWLVVRGTDSFVQTSQVWVYFDANRLGGVEEMRSVTVDAVASVRHYNGVDATMRWGVGHSAGAIQILSHK